MLKNEKKNDVNINIICEYYKKIPSQNTKQKDKLKKCTDIFITLYNKSL